MPTQRAPKAYSLEGQIRSIVDSSKFCDVSFLVGEERVLVRGHKAILALGSEVFERLLFGPLKMMDSDRPIEIPDLAPTGFLNAIKFIYGHRVDEFDLADFYVTYLAGDKYLIHGMTESMFAFVKEKLDEKNCCMIYDQLIRITKDEETMPLSEVRNLIVSNSRIAFESEFFVRIGLHTLMDLLQLHQLNISEIELLKCCSRWVSATIEQAGLSATPANKRAAFCQIKHLIRFGDLQPDELGAFTEIENLLEPQELVSLFFHLFDKSRPPAIEYEGLRAQYLYSVQISHLFNYGRTQDQLIVTLSVSKRMRISSIRTLLPATGIQDLKFRIQRSDDRPLSLDYDLLVAESKWCIQLKKAFEADPAYAYRLTFNFKPFHFDHNWQLSHQVKMAFSPLKRRVHKESHEPILFQFSMSHNCVHCVHRIDFCI